MGIDRLDYARRAGKELKCGLDLGPEEVWQVLRCVRTTVLLLLLLKLYRWCQALRSVVSGSV
jgi:hypothetical protein